ncbi:MAG: hypothetical protein HY699_21185 [Deltaproteobacteria bacterium]|nr:hypothetical protein [Deltaproteobacteria bacterium]
MNGATGARPKDCCYRAARKSPSPIKGLNQIEQVVAPLTAAATGATLTSAGGLEPQGA